MRSLERQKGITAIGWILIILLIGCVAFFLLKLVPIYIDGFTVEDVATSFNSNPDIGSMTPGEIRRDIRHRLSVNMITDVKPEDITVTKADNVVSIEIYYVKRTHLVGNIDLVVTFDKQANIPYGS